MVVGRPVQNIIYYNVLVWVYNRASYHTFITVYFLKDYLRLRVFCKIRLRLGTFDFLFPVLCYQIVSRVYI